MAPALRRANPKRDYAEYNDFKRLAADQLQTQLLDSDGYNAWLKDKTPVKRSVYVVAACILTLFCSSAIFVNSHNRGQVVATDQSNTILEALQHAQEENTRLIQEYYDLEAKLDFTRHELEVAKEDREALTLQTTCSQQPPPPIHNQVLASMIPPSPLTQLVNALNNWAEEVAPEGMEFEIIPEHLFIAAAAMLVLSFSGNVVLAIVGKKLKRQVEDLKAHLQEANFDKENAQQSLEILESELQRKLHQLADAQQKPPLRALASPRSTPRGLRPSSPSTPSLLGGGAATAGNGNNSNNNGQTTPGRSEIPPPPSVLVERFLEERRAVAVEEEQIIAWLEMEEQHKLMKERLDALEPVITQIDAAVLLKDKSDGNLLLSEIGDDDLFGNENGGENMSLNASRRNGGKGDGDGWKIVAKKNMR